MAWLTHSPTSTEFFWNTSEQIQLIFIQFPLQTRFLFIIFRLYYKKDPIKNVGDSREEESKLGSLHLHPTVYSSCFHGLTHSVRPCIAFCIGLVWFSQLLAGVGRYATAVG
ncbi:hypothetical protein J6590_040981 [Homalodisca vitripennis]|nr:hypothetical protein J6590_040981 [Homalodisca vitripennis]